MVLFLWVYLAFIYTAEIIISLISPYGVLIHIGILFSLYVHAVFLYSKHDLYKLYLALSLVPLIRIVNLSLPVFPVLPVYWYILVGVPLWASVFLLIVILKLRPTELGLKLGQIPLQIIIGFSLGIPLGLVTYLIHKPEPLISKLEIPSLLIAIIILFVFVAFLEELIFRGVLYKLAVEMVSQKFGFIFVSSIYCSLHIFYLSIENIFLVFSASIILTWLVKRFNSLLGVILAHGIASIGAYLVWPFFYNDLVVIFEIIKQEVKVKMISIINPLVKDFNMEALYGSQGIGPMVIIFLIILLIIKELAATTAEYSAFPQLYLADSLQRHINIGLFPLLYVFALNTLAKLVSALVY